MIASACSACCLSMGFLPGPLTVRQFIRRIKIAQCRNKRAYPHDQKNLRNRLRNIALNDLESRWRKPPLPQNRNQVSEHRPISNSDNCMSVSFSMIKPTHGFTHIHFDTKVNQSNYDLGKK